MSARSIVALLLLAGPAVAVAQQPNTPAACTKAANDWRTAQLAPARDAYNKATDSTRAALLAKYTAASTAALAGSQKMAADCAAGFNLTTVPAGQLMDLIALYGLSRDTTSARLATERLLTEKNLPPRAQGGAWMLGMQQELAKGSSVFALNPAAEAYVAKIDALPDSLADLKLSAHRTMLGRYEYLDVAEGLRQQSLALIAIARKLNKTQDMIAGYHSLARSYADRLHPDSALAILDEAEKECGAGAAESFKDFRERYALIGTKAPTISPAWWINTEAKSVVAPAPGKVTLVEFTAHWCGPCKNSYPGLNALAARLKGKDFQGFMVTQLYGYIGTQRNLTPEQEIAADREYFGKEHALAFPVAVNPQGRPAPGQPFVQPEADRDYRVGGIPQIMIIDKKGIIRQIVTGWDQGNIDRFSKLIDRLLAEK